MKKLIHTILLIVNSVFLILLLLAYLAPIVNPENMVLISYLGLVFTYLVIANIFFVLMWILLPKWYFVFSLLGLVIGIPGINRELPYRFESGEMEAPGNFKVMSYNVRVFNRYKWNKSPELTQEISNFYRSANADVICFQEFGVNNHIAKQNEHSIKKLLANWPHHYIEYGSNSSSYVKQGLAIFSKYPIIRQSSVKPDNGGPYSIYCDINIKGKVVRFFCCHLESIRLPNKESRLGKLLHTSLEQEKVSEEMSEISSSLKVAYKKRAGQVKYVSSYINASPYPVVVCGDFNDTPNSYAYKKVRGELSDAYMACGNGVGTTYNGGLPFLRIDYIFYDKKLMAGDFVRSKVLFSDHYPISCSLALKD